MSDQETDAAVGAHIRQMVAEGDRDELRLMLFHEHVLRRARSGRGVAAAGRVRPRRVRGCSGSG
jgi:hypothetical protein